MGMVQRHCATDAYEYMSYGYKTISARGKFLNPTIGCRIMAVTETTLFKDDVGFIAKLLKDNWSLGPGHEAPIEYVPESFIMNARQGAIYVYQVSRTNRKSTSDYRTYERRSDMTIRISNRFREEHFLWAQEVYRILMEWRRAGIWKLNGYSAIDVTSDHTDRDLSGFYTSNISIAMINFAVPIESIGMGVPGR